MRFAELIRESVVEDEADSRGDVALIDRLEFLRNRDHVKTHMVPRVRVDALIQLVQKQPGHEQFNLQGLEQAYKTNPAVKNIIKDIKDDEKTGIKYVYLAQFGDETDAGEMAPISGGPTMDPQAVVGSMAKRALKNRQ
jgi:sulfur relay (sulfurtransferase) DsrC/TusE family protein